LTALVGTSDDALRAFDPGRFIDQEAQRFTSAIETVFKERGISRLRRSRFGLPSIVTRK
jgi:hypothetical protein